MMFLMLLCGLKVFPRFEVFLLFLFVSTLVDGPPIILLTSASVLRHLVSRLRSLSKNKG